MESSSAMAGGTTDPAEPVPGSIGLEIVSADRTGSPDYDARAHRELALGNLFVELRGLVKDARELVRFEINGRKRA